MKVAILVVLLLVSIAFGSQVAKKSTAATKPVASKQILSKDFRTAGRRAVDAIEVYSSPSSTVDDMHAAFDAIKEAKIHRDNEADNRAAEVLEQFMQSVVHNQLHSDDASKDAYLSCEIEAETVFEHGPIYEVNPSSLAVLSQSLPKCGQAAASK